MLSCLLSSGLQSSLLAERWVLSFWLWCKPVVAKGFVLMVQEAAHSYVWPVAGTACVVVSKNVQRTILNSFVLNYTNTIICNNNHAISSMETLRIWPVFVPLWSGRGPARKKVTAVTFFRCPTVKSFVRFIMQLKKNAVTHLCGHIYPTVLSHIILYVVVPFTNMV